MAFCSHINKSISSAHAPEIGIDTHHALFRCLELLLGLGQLGLVLFLVRPLWPAHLRRLVFGRGRGRCGRFGLAGGGRHSARRLRWCIGCCVRGRVVGGKLLSAGRVLHAVASGVWVEAELLAEEIHHDHEARSPTVNAHTHTRTELPPRRAAKWTLTLVGLARHSLLAMLLTCALSLHLLTFAVDSHTFA